MPLAPESRRLQYALRAGAVGAAALALVSVGGTAYAGSTLPFGSPYRARASGPFGVPQNSPVYSGTAAVAQLTAIAAATRSAAAGGALVSGSQFSDGITAHLTVADDGTTAAKVQVTGPLAEVLYQSTTEQYVQIDTTDPSVLAALQLLHVSGVHYAGRASADPLVGPADMIADLYANGAPPISSMKRTEHYGSVAWQIAVNVPVAERGEIPDSATVTTDRSGRITAYSESISHTLDGAQYTVSYGPQTVTLPAAQDVVDATQLQQAMVSAQLPQALAFVAVQAFVNGAPRSGAETAAQFQTAARTAATDPGNGMAGISVAVANVTNGVTLTARNPFTSVNVTVRAVLDGHGWISVTDSAGRPLDPYGVNVTTALELGRTPAARLGIRR